MKLFKKLNLISHITILIILGFGLISFSQNALASATVTAGLGGSTISADTNITNGTSATWTNISTTNPTITEGSFGDIGLGTIILNAPSGFQFNTTSSVTATVTTNGNCSSGTSVKLNSSLSQTVTPATGTITINVSQVSSGSGSACKSIITYTGIKVRPSTGTPLASGNITKSSSSTSTISGVTNGSTNFGTLTESAGAVSAVSVSPASPTVASGSTQQFTATATDTYGNTLSGQTFTWSITSGPGSINSSGLFSATTAGTSTVKALDGATVFGTATITTTTAPDLTAGATSPTTSTAGATQTFSSTISNSGTASTGAGFTTLFQKANDSIGTGAVDVGTYANTTITAGGTQTATLSYVLPNTVGTIYMRACADKSSMADTGTITESNSGGTGESNNCGAWTAVTLTAGTLDHFAFSNVGTQVAGTPFNVTITAQDVNNNTVTSYTGSTAKVNFTVTSGTISPTQSSTFTSGVLTNQSITLTGTNSAMIITATDNGGTGKTGTSNSFTVNAGAVSAITVSPSSASFTAGSSSTQQFTATAKDANNNTRSGDSFTWSITAGGGSITSGGVYTSGNTAGNFTVTATDGAVSGTATVTITAGAVANVTVSPASATVTAGSTQQFTATARDSGGNTVSGQTFTWSVSGGLGTISSTGLYTAKTAGTFTVTATDNSISGNASVTVNAGTFTKLQILLPGETASAGSSTGKTGTPSAQTAGVSFSVIVNGVDANWNVVSSAIDTVSITSTDGSATLPVTSALIGGTKTFSVTLNTVGTKTITASDTVSHSGITANTSPSITVNAGVVATVTVSPASTSVTQGSITTTQFTATSKDSAGNTISGDTINWSVSTNGGSITSGGLYTPSTTAGSYTITATDGSVSGTATATINAAPDLTIGAINPTSVNAGSAQTYTATITNLGGGSTGATFTTLFQSATDANGTGAVDLGTDADAILSGGGTQATTFSYTNNTAGTFYMRACADKSSAGNAGVISEWNSGGTGELNNCGAWTAITVNAGAFSKLQLLVPGETANPGSATGKTGTPTTETAGIPFNVTVNAVDANWNVVSSTHTIKITSSDGAATLPVNSALISGTKNFTITLNTYTSKTWTITATDVTDGTKTANTSPGISINRGLDHFSFATIADQTTGVSFPITITAKDSQNNTVTGFAGSVNLTTNDTSITPTVSGIFSSGVATVSAVTLTGTGASKTITATDAAGTGIVGTSNTFRVYYPVTSTSPLSPTTTGNLNSWYLSGSAPTKQSALADIDDTTFISFGPDAQTFTMTNSTIPPGANILGVTLNVTAAKPTGGATTSMQMIAENGTGANQQIIDGTVRTLTKTFTNYSWNIPTMPDGSPWTLAEVNNWTTKFGILKSNFTGTAEVSKVWVSVAYSTTSSTPSCKLGVDLSGDGGLTWGNEQTTASLSTTNQTYVLGGSGDTWGNGSGWNATNLANGKFIARVHAVNYGNSCSSTDVDYLDWIRLKATFKVDIARQLALQAADAAKKATTTPIDIFSIYFDSSKFANGNGLTNANLLASIASGSTPNVPYQNGSANNIAGVISDSDIAVPLVSAVSPSEWTNPDNALTSASYATSSTGQQQGYTGFGFNVPPVATITGIEADMSAFNTNGGDIKAEISTDGGTTYTNTSALPGYATATLTGTAKSVSIGGTGKLWGRNNWISSDFNTGNVVLKLINDASGGTISVNQIKIKVYYTVDSANADGDNFFIAPNSSNITDIFNFIGEQVCPALLYTAQAPPPTTATITTIVRTINSNSGTKQSSNFSVNVNPTSQSTTTFSGSDTPGTSTVINPDTYTVSESPMTGYTESFGAGCIADGTTDYPTLIAGETRVCIITNNDIPAPPPPPNLNIIPSTWQEIPTQ